MHEVANAPSVNASRIAAMYQLDFMNPKTAALAKLDDIDLSLLSRFLCLEEEVKDEEVPWTWDYVFASVSSEMREEWAQEEEHEDTGYEDERRVK
ncbi:unnamed protein product [Gongylonema pulchrum]|uniref:Uncharacterized protein n=1 Tax=Gongylonema pulchrum TaxID=637853 RepID=A0A3P7R6F6_9BILA|nr:unnamed protein product [Gongylonema pulchrum]